MNEYLQTQNCQRPIIMSQVRILVRAQDYLLGTKMKWFSNANNSEMESGCGTCPPPTTTRDHHSNPTKDKNVFLIYSSWKFTEKTQNEGFWGKEHLLKTIEVCWRLLKKLKRKFLQRKILLEIELIWFESFYRPKPTFFYSHLFLLCFIQKLDVCRCSCRSLHPLPSIFIPQLRPAVKIRWEFVFSSKVGSCSMSSMCFNDSLFF